MDWLVTIQTDFAAKALMAHRVDRKTEFDDLLAAFGHLLHQEHPNSERVGCPGRAALAALATDPMVQDAESVLKHVRQCAPCLDELKTLRSAGRH